GNGAHVGYNCPAQVPSVQTLPSFPQQFPCCEDSGERSDSLDENIISGLPLFSAITPDEPVLSTEEPDNSLSMGDEHLDTILATDSDEFIKSGVENLIPIPSESEGIPDHMCDVPSIDNSPPLDVSKDQIEDFSESNEEFSSTDDDSFSFDNIDYVEASPLNFELVSSEVMEIVIPEDKDYDSERNILIPKDLPSNNSLSFAEKESFHYDIPLFSRTPAKPPDGDTGILNIKMMGDIYDQKAFMHKLMITLAPHQEKSPNLLFHVVDATRSVTRNSNTNIFTPFANLKRQFQARKDITPISVHNIYSFYKYEPSHDEFEAVGEIDIETLMMEQYLALDHGDTRRGVKKPEIEGNVDFEIKDQFLREPRYNTLSGNENEDTYKHVGRILEIGSLFNNLGVSEDAIMLQVFPLTLTGRAKRWLTAARAMVTIQEMAYHSHKWHDEEENVHAIKGRSLRNRSKLKEILGKYLEESFKRQGMFDEWMERYRENTDKNLKRYDFPIKGLEENVLRLAQAVKIHRRLVLATAHARIDVFGRKISLVVGMEKFVFNANEGKTLLSVCVINDFQINWDTLEVLSDDEMGIILEDLGEGTENFWDA
nr:hypothetical protein [Tanacetum cinerariifolium]